jgi:hypothetical protein
MSKLVTEASSRFFMRTLIVVVEESSVDVNFLPDVGAMIESIFRSLSEIVPMHVPLFGCLDTAKALLPGLPLNNALTLTQ